MANTTLDYDSMEKWVKLALWAAKEHRAWEEWVADGHEARDPQNFFHSIARHAKKMGFSLRVRKRISGFRNMIRQIEDSAYPHDNQGKLYQASWQFQLAEGE
jgi:hypothetical protein